MVLPKNVIKQSLFLYPLWLSILYLMFYKFNNLVEATGFQFLLIFPVLDAELALGSQSRRQVFPESIQDLDELFFSELPIATSPSQNQASFFGFCCRKFFSQDLLCGLTPCPLHKQILLTVDGHASPFCPLWVLIQICPSQCWNLSQAKKEADGYSVNLGLQFLSAFVTQPGACHISGLLRRLFRGKPASIRCSRDRVRVSMCGHRGMRPKRQRELSFTQDGQSKYHPPVSLKAVFALTG